MAIKYNTKNNRKRLSPNVMFHDLILWLANCLTKSNSREVKYAMDIYRKIFTILETRGKPEAIKYCKDLRLRFMSFILSMNHDFVPKVEPWLPKSFKSIISHVKTSKSYPFIRLIFSVLYISRFMRLDPVPSFSTIETGPRKGTPLIEDRLVIRFLKEIGVNTKRDLGRIPRRLLFKEFHMSSKSGPNGHAIWTSFRDAVTLSQMQIEAIRSVSGDKLPDLISRFTSLYRKIPRFFEGLSTRKGSLVTRKLMALPDKEGKTREVAVFDYYSQAALLPLHNFLMRRLSLIDQDCTLNQTKHFRTIVPDLGSSYHSIDLTAFTDRFPISVNYKILSIWFGESFAKGWMQLMVYTPFRYAGRDIYYMTGNPMGGYSSWASTSLAHHFLVFLACHRAGRKWRKCPYMLLGDDLVIGNDRVAKAYLEILDEWGIDFSPSKTHVSEYGFEFAKQIRLHGENVSPFPLSALYERQTEGITSLGIILSEVVSKDWKSDVLDVVEEYYCTVLKWSRPRFRNFKPRAGLMVSFVLFLQGVSDLGTALVQYVADSRRLSLDLPLPMFSLFEKDVAMQTLRKLFEESRERIINPKTGGSLGDLATQMVMAITSLRDGGADCFDLIEAVPFLQIYGRAEEKYIKLSKIDDDDLFCPASALGNFDPKDFRDLFDTVDIPLQDSGFYTRHRDKVILQAMKSVRIMIPIINSELKFYQRFLVPIKNEKDPK